MRRYAAVLLLALPLLGATKACETDCDRAKAAAEEICGATPGSTQCELAKEAAAEACKPKPTPTPGPSPKCEPGQTCECWASIDTSSPLKSEAGWGWMTCATPNTCVAHVCTAPPECLPGVPWCHELVPPATCGNCKHQPPGEACQMAPPCEPTDPCQGVSCPVGQHCSGGKCVVDPPQPPPTTACPKPLAPGSTVYLNNKRYGNGIDSTVRVAGDPAFCQAIHGVAVNDCHLEGWAQRSECEMELLHGCPIWEYSMNGTGKSGPCLQAPHPDASCDHWGDPVYRDDPQTPAFEGQPLECGNQRDASGDPTAGFFVIGHGLSWFRACRPDGEACGPWTPGKDKQ